MCALLRLKPTFFLFLILQFHVSVLATTAETSEQVLSRFFDALKKNDVNAATELAMSFPEFPDGYLRSKIERAAEATAQGETPKIIRSRELTSLAVVIIDEKPSNDRPDIDPIYLIKDGDVWKVTINMEFDAASRVKVPDRVVEEFGVLSGWFTSEKAALKQQTR
ncbi:MAG: hypothetical protein JNG86_05825 [Verrucomicrobiaceae bacterium]|nr:hypothetical protein [Verrucomicrobiaceae bacterium]